MSNSAVMTFFFYYHLFYEILLPILRLLFTWWLIFVFRSSSVPRDLGKNPIYLPNTE